MVVNLNFVSSIVARAHNFDVKVQNPGLVCRHV